MVKAREKFWLFGVRPHQDDALMNGLKYPGQRHGSRITPAEGAFMLDVPNMIMVCADGVPAPFSDDAKQYCESFRRCKNVFWSASGSNGYRTGNEEAFICRLAEMFPNVSGVFLDDFLGELDTEEKRKKAENTLKEIRRGLSRSPRPLPIYAVCYAALLVKKYCRVFDYIDGLTLWTWDSNELPLLEKRYRRFERLFPKHKKMLGIYLYDFLNRTPVPVERMKLQCELGLSLLREKRVDGLIFESNSVMGVGMPSEAWLYEWLQTAADVEVPE
ncbi:MAG: hypothetical protein BWY31_03676 [Lentisphaerae bacterium ADurb.Bin242]|nr:MAG: hypothetical protein BWY31_03676 [Lentisphaerae bacterium ADurb.Bin242]